jgi:pyridoxal phosphate enzyme (YggS family)
MSESLSQEIKARLADVNEKIAYAAAEVGRDPSDIELIAVTKQKSAAVIKSLVENGVNKIGESYLKEAEFKIELLSDFPIEWHMIGTIQSGKEKQIAYYFDFIQSVDSVELARQISKFAGQMDKRIPIYLEFNVSGEATKQGFPGWEDSGWDKHIPDVETILELPSIDVRGLMTMAPYSKDPEDSRPYFKKLRKLKDFLNKNISDGNINGLSMGMSGDYQVAIEEGSTMLRIGTAIVGQR